MSSHIATSLQKRGVWYMGLDCQIVKYLLMRRPKIDFQKTATLGRQQMYVDRADQQELRERFHLPFSESDLSQIFAWEGFSEPFFRFLGAEEIISIDASDYEGATLIHDLNRPVPQSVCDRFTTVIDSGTLEHIFNFPQAIQNCMKMVKVGGQFISITVANNFLGHGFYQFSPELFYRVFCRAHGFNSEESILCEARKGWWYRVTDPAAIKRRVEFTNLRPMYLIHRARRVGMRTDFSTWPQQSDYECGSWMKVEASVASSTKAKLRLPEPLFRIIANIRHWVSPPQIPGLMRVDEPAPQHSRTSEI
jgi:hypothetical protein